MSNILERNEISKDEYGLNFNKPPLLGRCAKEVNINTFTFILTVDYVSLSD